MSFFVIKWKERGATPGVTKRELGRILKAAWQHVGEYWHKHFRPKHFTEEGAAEYGYTKRKGERMGPGAKGFKRSYTGKKKKKFGHTLPLVWSGQSRFRTQLRDVRATSKGARIVMRAPALNFKHPKSRVNMREELTTISEPELKKLHEEMDAAMQRGINAVRSSKTQTLVA